MESYKKGHNVHTIFSFLANKFNKEIVIDDAFIEIPSHDIPLDKKKTWLEEIIKMDKDELPKNIKSWREKIFVKLKDIKNHSIIFTYFCHRLAVEREKIKIQK